MRHIVGQTAWRGVTVLVDGEPVTGWIEADDEDGYVLVPEHDASGALAVDRDGHVVTTRREGLVTFVPDPEAA